MRVFLIFLTTLPKALFAGAPPSFPLPTPPPPLGQEAPLTDIIPPSIQSNQTTTTTPIPPTAGIDQQQTIKNRLRIAEIINDLLNNIAHLLSDTIFPKKGDRDEGDLLTFTPCYLGKKISFEHKNRTFKVSLIFNPDKRWVVSIEVNSQKVSSIFLLHNFLNSKNDWSWIKEVKEEIFEDEPKRKGGKAPPCSPTKRTTVI